ncbi:MAG: enoyl-CoA hydratase-related protein [Proteobacteria bacterium]|nr:enoyl-CoA hydratase-related protein [Pseudomonadota bacterium]MDA1308484.1 enoyl-CoA hydratase-related protein [Pseudomonadota bacterium]
MSDPVVLLDVDHRGVATVTINRPEVNNAYNSEMIQAMIDGVTQCAADDAVRVIVIRGNGRHFQAGADLKWLKEIGKLSPAENVAVSRSTASAIRGLTEIMKPTVALIHGGCFGGGTGIAAACDIVIASEDALFSITETRWGVMASVIIPQLNAAIGSRNTRRYALTCERFDAAKAFELGLVHQVCPTGGLDAAAAPVITNLLMAAPNAIAQTKRATLNDAGLLVTDAYFEELVQMHAAKRQTDEAMEGLASFAEKREPSWYPGD